MKATFNEDQGVWEGGEVYADRVGHSLIEIATADCPDGWRAIVSVYCPRYVALGAVFKELAPYPTEEEAIVSALKSRIRRIDLVKHDEEHCEELEELQKGLNEKLKMYEDAVARILVLIEKK